MSQFGLASPAVLLNLPFFQVLIWQFLASANYGWKSRPEAAIAMQSPCLRCAEIPILPWPRSSGATLRLTCFSRCCRNSVLAGVGAFIFSTIIITLFGEIIPQKRGHALTPVFTPSASRAYRLGLLTDNKASRCSVNNRKLDSKADSACTASKVGAPAARRRAIRLFCSATIFCASQRDVGPERGDRRPP